MKALVVGYGSIAKRHIAALLQHTDVSGIRVITRMAHDAGGFPADKISFADRIGRTECDFAVIANKTREHVATAEILAAREIPLFIEKPLALRRAGTEHLLETVRRLNVPVRVAYNLRYVGVYRRIKGLLEQNALGKIHFADIQVGQYLPDWQPGRDYRQSYRAKKEEGGDVGLELSHEVDCMRFFFGDPQTRHVLTRKVSDLEIETDDLFEGLYGFADGMTCRVHMDYLRPLRTRTIFIQGGKGSVSCDVFGKTCTLHAGDKTETLADADLFDFNSSYPSELGAFIDLVRGRPENAKYLATLDDALKALDLVTNQ